MSAARFFTGMFTSEAKASEDVTGENVNQIASLHAQLLVERQERESGEKELRETRELLARLEGAMEQQAKVAAIDQAHLAALEGALAQQKEQKEKAPAEEDQEPQVHLLQAQFDEERLRREQAEKQLEEMQKLLAKLEETIQEQAKVTQLDQEQQDKMAVIVEAWSDERKRAHGLQATIDGMEQKQQADAAKAATMQSMLSQQTAQIQELQERLIAKDNKVCELQRSLQGELAKIQVANDQIIDKERTILDLRRKLIEAQSSDNGGSANLPPRNSDMPPRTMGYPSSNSCSAPPGIPTLPSLPSEGSLASGTESPSLQAHPNSASLGASRSVSKATPGAGATSRSASRSASCSISQQMATPGSSKTAPVPLSNSYQGILSATPGSSASAPVGLPNSNQGIPSATPAQMISRPLSSATDPHAGQRASNQQDRTDGSPTPPPSSLPANGARSPRADLSKPVLRVDMSRGSARPSMNAGTSSQAMSPSTNAGTSSQAMSPRCGATEPLVDEGRLQVSGRSSSGNLVGQAYPLGDLDAQISYLAGSGGPAATQAAPTTMAPSLMGSVNNFPELVLPVATGLKSRQTSEAAPSFRSTSSAPGQGAPGQGAPGQGAPCPSPILEYSRASRMEVHQAHSPSPPYTEGKRVVTTTATALDLSGTPTRPAPKRTLARQRLYVAFPQGLPSGESGTHKRLAMASRSYT